MLTHADILRSGAAGYGPRVAVSFEGRDITYTELDSLTNRLARGLLDAGLRSGQRVAWIMTNHVDYLLLYYATAKAGLALSPMNPRLPQPELQPQLDLVDPALVVVAPGLGLEGALPDRPVVAHGSPQWHNLLDGASRAIDPVPETTLHEIVFTSGTTGQAKGVMRSQRKRILDSMAAALAYQLTRDDHMLFFAPQFHVGGGAAAGQVLLQGARVTILPGFDVERTADAIDRGVTYMLGVPAHYSLLVESGVLAGRHTSSMRGCFVGGSVASRQQFELIRSTFPRADIVHGYGSTESGPHTAAVRGQAFLDHFGTIGLPVPGTEIRVVDTDGREIHDDRPGELHVRAATVMDGYLGRPDLTEAAFAPGGWLRTGDVVRRDTDGYLFLVDRLKDMIITGGENVYPTEVEAALCAYPGVLEAAVIGEPDPIYEERLLALVRLSPGASVTPAALTEHLRRSLAPYKVPRRFEIVDDLPRTPLGKIAKAELRRRYGSVFDP